MIVRARVPATTANIGPGFDCLGMALSLYNEFEWEVLGAEREMGHSGARDDQVRVRVLANDMPFAAIPLSKNLVYHAFSRTLRDLGVRAREVTLRMLRADIPIARGLGSSAACIVGGVLAAGKIAENLGMSRMEFAEAMDLAVEMEGHPDNVVPAMVGGMTAAVRVEEAGSRFRTIFTRANLPIGLTLAAMVPDFRLTTEEARGVLPDTYSCADTVFNIGRVALLTASLASGDLSVLRTAIDDRVHQPYRLRLIPHSADIVAISRAAGSEAEFVSGSGPTIMAIIQGDGTGFAGRVSELLAEIPGGWVVHLLRPEMSGAEVWVEPRRK